MLFKGWALFIAKIVFLGAEKGGRDYPPQTGYHPQIDIRGTHTSCVIESLDNEEVFAFEKEHLVSLRLMFPDQYPDPFHVGDAISLYEGNRLIGTGRIVQEQHA